MDCPWQLYMDFLIYDPLKNGVSIFTITGPLYKYWASMDKYSFYHIVVSSFLNSSMWGLFCRKVYKNITHVEASKFVIGLFKPPGMR